MKDCKEEETGCPNDDRSVSDAILKRLDGMQRRLRTLAVAVVFLALAVLLCAAVVHGYLANYFGSDVLMYSATSTGATLLGFGFGWFARGRR